MLFTPSHLHNALAQIGVAHPGDIFERLAIAYSEPWRHYHTQAHIRECLTQFHWFKMNCSRDAQFLFSSHSSEIEIALYFHDAVYDPQRHDNEEKSAQWAYEYLASKGAIREATDRITQCILATKTHQTRNPITALLLDLDLSILGASPDRFQAYDSEIRQEYYWMPILQYNLARYRLLKSFMERVSIYNTSNFQKQYEAQARENLGASIVKLKASL